MRSVTAGYNGGVGVGGGGLEVFRIRTATLSDAANPPDSTREGLSTMSVPIHTQESVGCHLGRYRMPHYPLSRD